MRTRLEPRYLAAMDAAARIILFVFVAIGVIAALGSVAALLADGLYPAGVAAPWPAGAR